MALSNGNHFKMMTSLTEKYKIPKNKAIDILLEAEHKGRSLLHEHHITISWDRKSGFQVHSEEDWEE